MPNAESAQRPFVIRLARVRSPWPVKTMKATSSARPGFGVYQRGQIDRLGVDLLHVRQRQAEVADLAAAAEDERVDVAEVEPGGELGVLGVGDDPLDLAELGLLRRVAVGAQEDGDGADPAQRGDHGERARAGPHQHADVLALADAERDQAADDVVDPGVDRGAVVGAVLVEEERGVGVVARLLVEDEAERDAGVRVDPLQPDRAAAG